MEKLCKVQENMKWRASATLLPLTSKHYLHATAFFYLYLFTIIVENLQSTKGYKSKIWKHRDKLKYISFQYFLKYTYFTFYILHF